MAPVAPLLLASLLAVSDLTTASPLNPGRHMAPAVYNLGFGNVKRGLRKLTDRYYGDSHGLTRPPQLESKRATTIPSGWSAVGCMNESNNQRLLQGTSFTSSSMTPLLCMTQCQKSGYTYAATEYSDECYCGNSFVGSGGQKQPDSSCNMACKGDSSSMCGASWFLNLYQYTASSDSCGTASAGGSSSPSKTTSAPYPVFTDSTDASQWYALGCAIDSQSRLLKGYSQLNYAGMTIDSCLTTCEGKGFAFAGVEYGNQCYCGANLPVNVTYASNMCNTPCPGDSKETCGGYWAMEVFELISSYNANSTDCPADAGTTTAATAATTRINNGYVAIPSVTVGVTVGVTTKSVTLPSSTLGGSSTVTPQPTSSPPASSGTNQVWAHHMVGNTYPYSQSDWMTDILAAHAQGIDGFALNMGTESWQADRAADAYTAAQNSGTGFKLFLSLDMTSLGCWSGNDAQNLINLVSRWANHPNQAQHNGKVLVSTFAGSDCNFGTGSGSSAWQSSFVTPLKNNGINIFFIPSIFSDISTFSSNSWMDGELNWNSAWPMGNSQISTDTDKAYMNALGGKEYMAAVSPYFFTHYGSDLWNKNWLYRGDDWMYCTRWEQIISMRNTVKQVEILTWNDYGESSYIGPIHGAMPGYADRWVNGFDHTGLTALTNYYATAYKTGSYPSITKDTLIIWSRPHSYNANANDYIGKPTGWDWTTDYVWAVAMTTTDSVVSLTSGSNTQTFSVKAGLTKLKIANSPGSVNGQIYRSNNVVAQASLNNFSWTTTPSTYNYNYMVGSSS